MNVVKDDRMRASSRRFSTPECEPSLTREARKAAGVYYTPSEIVRLIVEQTLEPLLDAEPLTVLDPACGAGEFLVEAWRRISAKPGVEAARRGVQGMDIDRGAVALARRRLSELGLSRAHDHVVVGDALDATGLKRESFDAIVGNPPYVNVRQLAKCMSPEGVDGLRERFCTARGNFDLYVLFIERAIELLKPGGRCGLIVPNKWATMDYARPCRELLLGQTTIEQVIDLSREKVFAGASVYPHVLIFCKKPASASHAIRVREFGYRESRQIKQQKLSPESISLTATFDVEDRMSTLPLGEVAALACGTAGYSAQRIARRLVDCGQTGRASAKRLADFITSGNIDRYAVRIGNVRYLNHDYVQPKLPLDISELTPAKRRLFRSKKIVVAGISRRLEAAWDDRGLALGVQVFAASDFRLDPFYVLALLNSKLLSYLFATRFAAKRLGSGYLAINKGQLALLPIRCVDRGDSTDRRRHDRLAELAAGVGGREEASCRHDGVVGTAHRTVAAEVEIDELVYGLYRLTEAEIAGVEAHFDDGAAKAA